MMPTLSTLIIKIVLLVRQWFVTGFPSHLDRKTPWATFERAMVGAATCPFGPLKRFLNAITSPGVAKAVGDDVEPPVAL